jgi:Ca-activated chloride channel family protein
VSWEGPDNEGDYITVVSVGAPDDDYGDYSYTSRGNPAELTAPETPGSYELRYITGQSGLVLARRSLSVR